MNSKDKTQTTLTRTRKSNAERTVAFWMAGALMTLLVLTKAVQAQEADSKIAPKAVHHTIQQSAHNELGLLRRGNSGISYHGGPLLGTVGNAVHVYVIW